MIVLAVEESQTKLQTMETVSMEYQRAQEEAAEQARKARELEEQLQLAENAHESEKRRLVRHIQLTMHTGKPLMCQSKQKVSAFLVC